MGILISVPASADTKLFLMGGQSNMAGLGGYDTPLPTIYNTPPQNVKFWDYGTPQPVDGLYGNFTHPWVGDHWVELTGGFGHMPQYFGSEVNFGRKLHELYPNDEIYIVKEAISNSNLAIDWNPNGSDSIYNRFKERANAAIAKLVAEGKTPQIVGMVWMQGSGDVILGDTYAQAYKDNLKGFIAKVRQDFNAPNAKFVIGRNVNYTYGTQANLDLIRAAHVEVPQEVANCSWVNTDDLQWGCTAHFGTEGQLELGERFANEIAPVPEPAAATLSGIGCCVLAAWRFGKAGNKAGARCTLFKRRR